MESEKGRLAEIRRRIDRAARRAPRLPRAPLGVLRNEAGASAVPSSEIGAAKGLITLAQERLDRFERAAIPRGPSRTRVLFVLDDLDRSCRAPVDAGREEGADAT